MEILTNIKLAMAFVLELCMLAALGYWGFTLEQGLALRVVAGVGAPLLADAVLAKQYRQRRISHFLINLLTAIGSRPTYSEDIAFRTR